MSSKLGRCLVNNLRLSGGARLLKCLPALIALSACGAREPWGSHAARAATERETLIYLLDNEKNDLPFESFYRNGQYSYSEIAEVQYHQAYVVRGNEVCVVKGLMSDNGCRRLFLCPSGPKLIFNSEIKNSEGARNVCGV